MPPTPTPPPPTTPTPHSRYWDQRYPRLLSSSNLKDLAAREGGPYLRAIADVTCDIGGSVEATVKATPPEVMVIFLVKFSLFFYFNFFVKPK